MLQRSVDGLDVGNARGRTRATAWAIMAPVAAVAVWLPLHLLLPSLQSSLPTRLYPGLLTVILLAWLLVAAISWGLPRVRTWAMHYGPLLAGAVFLMGVWDLVTLKLNWAPLPFFPGPDRVFQGMWDDRIILLQSAYRSLLLQTSGFLTGAAAGIVSGVMIGWSRKLRYWGMPVLKLIGPIPATAYVPLMMVLFSDAFISGSALIALTVWFPVTMLTTSGIANVPVALLDVARTLGAGRRYLIFHVAIPSALPHIFLGLFMGLGASFLTLVVAETVGVKSGYSRVGSELCKEGSSRCSGSQTATAATGVMMAHAVARVRPRALPTSNPSTDL